jgi:hypothetical protein
MCVPMFYPMVYGVFDPFSSMIQILLRIFTCLIFCEFSSIFSALETRKLKLSVFDKMGPVYR